MLVKDRNTYDLLSTRNSDYVNEAVVRIRKWVMKEDLLKLRQTWK